jgi:hypothetical protein
MSLRQSGLDPANVVTTNEKTRTGRVFVTKALDAPPPQNLTPFLNPSQAGVNYDGLFTVVIVHPHL